MQQPLFTNRATASTKRFSIYPSLVIGLCGIFLIYKYLLQVYPNVMTGDLMRTFHLTEVGLGNLAAMHFYAYVVAQMFQPRSTSQMFQPRKCFNLAIEQSLKKGYIKV